MTDLDFLYGLWIKQNFSPYLLKTQYPRSAAKVTKQKTIGILGLNSKRGVLCTQRGDTEQSHMPPKVIFFLSIKILRIGLRLSDNEGKGLTILKLLRNRFGGTMGKKNTTSSHVRFLEKARCS